MPTKKVINGTTEITDKVTNSTNSPNSDTASSKDKNPASSRKEDKSKNAKTNGLTNSKSSPQANNDNVIQFMKELQETIVQQAASINEKIDSKINDLGTKINELSKSVDERIENITSTIQVHIEPVVDTIVKPITQALESRIEKPEREALILNLVVTGIPWRENKNIDEIVNAICRSIGFNNNINGFTGYYRILKQKSSKPTKPNALVMPPLDLKFWCHDLKHNFFMMYLQKKTLNLSHIGYGTASRIYVNEMHTLVNKQIFLKARQLQHQKIIFQSHTNRGLVVIKKSDKSKNEVIYNMDQLLHIEQLALSVLLNPGNMAPTLVGMADKQFQCDVAVEGCLILNLLKCINRHVKG
ncbi:hypothetical protein Bhyg_01431 [Pseudolycoriella hygida]|uniref:Uncharacterized protein n=1 Tax=Pseudolycoriella hygida TaxID=35572 RepID=A0A9Q0S7D5_9DIPT|nr:hypothetical protein Bhyg_01431 [Pseudolycoriella hygida]